MRVINVGIDELIAHKELTFIAPIAPEEKCSWVLLARAALEKAGLRPKGGRTGNPLRAKFEYGSFDLNLHFHSRQGIRAQVFLLPKTLKENPPQAWADSIRALEVVEDVFSGGPPSERAPIILSKITLQVDVEGAVIRQGTRRLKRASSLSEPIPMFDKKTREFTGFNFWQGKDVAVRFYRKDIEVKRHPKKDYIEKLWPEDVKGPVWRIEFVFTEKDLCQFAGELLTSDHLNQLWQQGLTERVWMVRKARANRKDGKSEEFALNPLWRLLQDQEFVAPWEESVGPRGPVPLRVPDDVVQKRKMGNGRGGIAQILAFSGDYIKADMEDAGQDGLRLWSGAHPKYCEELARDVDNARREMGAQLLLRYVPGPDGRTPGEDPEAFVWYPDGPEAGCTYTAFHVSLLAPPQESAMEQTGHP